MDMLGAGEAVMVRLGTSPTPVSGTVLEMRGTSRYVVHVTGSRVAVLAYADQVTRPGRSDFPVRANRGGDVPMV